MKLVIFDIDGTLTDTNNLDSICFIQAVREVFKIDLDKTDWNKYKNVTSEGITQEIVGEHFGRVPKKDEVESLKRRFTDLLAESITNDMSLCQAIPGSCELMNELNHNHDYYPGIATGGWHGPSVLKLDHVNISYSHLPFGYSDLYTTKQEIINHVVKLIQKVEKRNPVSITYVGDRKYDYQVAQELGIDFIGVDVFNDGKLAELGVKKIVKDFSDPDCFFNLIG